MVAVHLEALLVNKQTLLESAHTYLSAQLVDPVTPAEHLHYLATPVRSANFQGHFSPILFLSEVVTLSSTKQYLVVP